MKRMSLKTHSNYSTVKDNKMAPNKPAKRNITNSVEKTKIEPGKAVKYFGSKNALPFSCPTCLKTLIKGIVYEDNSSSYCSRTCIPKPQ